MSVDAVFYISVFWWYTVHGWPVFTLFKQLLNSQKSGPIICSFPVIRSNYYYYILKWILCLYLICLLLFLYLTLIIQILLLILSSSDTHWHRHCTICRLQLLHIRCCAICIMINKLFNSIIRNQFEINYVHSLKRMHIADYTY